MKQRTLRIPAVFFVLLVVVALQACRTPKDVPVVDNGSEPVTERLAGTVISSPECGFYITVIQGDVLRSYFAVNLEDKFKVDGMKVKFAWKKAKVEPPKDCPDLIVVSVSDVTPLR